MRTRLLSWLPSVVFLVICTAVLSCNSVNSSLRLGEEMVQQRNWDGAVAAYREALRDDPFNEDVLKIYGEVKAKAAQIHYGKGREFLKLKKLPEALQEFEIALGLDPAKREHHAALGDVVRLKEARQALKDAHKLRSLGRLDEAMNAYERAIERDPNLVEALEGITAIAEEQKRQRTSGWTTEAVTLRFQNTKLKQVFEVLARAATITILFEKDVRDVPVTIFMKETPFDEALNLILSTNQLFARRVAPDTLLIIPDTTQKRQQYQDLQIRTFYLSNAKATDMSNLLRTILEIERVYVNETLNTVILRDVPEKLQLAERIIFANDQRNSEVVFDIEVLEVNRTKSRRLGARFAKQIGAGIFPGTENLSFGEGTQTFRFQQLTSLGKNSVLFTFPSNVLLEFFKSESDAKTLASPQLRVLNNQKASINVGDKQPILLSTTNVNPGTGQGTTPTTSTATSVEFKDTGVKVDVDPTIHLTGQVTIKLKVEVTRLGDRVRLQDSPRIDQFRFGTRTAETTLNLRDGETVILAGLIQEEDRKTRDTIPGLENVPILEDLFSSEKRKIQTEVMIAITPRIIRYVEPVSLAKRTLWSGTGTRYATEPIFTPKTQPSVSVPSIKSSQEDISSTADAASKPAGPPQPSPPPIIEQATSDHPHPTAAVVLTPAAVTTGPGQSFQIRLVAESFPEVRNARITLTYNPEQLEFDHAQLGDFFPTQEDRSPLTVSASPATRTIILQMGHDETTAKGDGVLAVLTFTTKSQGQSPLVVNQSDVTGASGRAVPVTVRHGLIHIL